MNLRKGLVLDANILLRAVFGIRVRQLLETYEDTAVFCAPDECFQDAQDYIPDLANRRGIDSALALSVLEQVSRIVTSVDRSLYESYEQIARERIQRRDPDDWPVVAVALMLSVPVWTEDKDFFGSGIPTWTTDRVELYLRGSAYCRLLIAIPPTLSARLCAHENTHPSNHLPIPVCRDLRIRAGRDSSLPRHAAGLDAGKLSGESLLLKGLEH